MTRNHILCLLLFLISAAALDPAQAQRANDCPRCYGTRKCQNCYGKGYTTHPVAGAGPRSRDCGACNSTGRCSYCNGSGLDPNNTYDTGNSFAAGAAAAASGGDAPKKHIVEGRSRQYEYLRITTTDERDWLVETQSPTASPSSWQMLGNFQQTGEDANYWFIAKGSGSDVEKLAVPKNRYGEVMKQRNGSWEVAWYICRDYRFVHVDIDNYSFIKTFCGPGWIKQQKPMGGTGMASFVEAWWETGEDDDYWYITNGSSNLTLAKYGNEIGKRSDFTPVVPQEPAASSSDSEPDDEYRDDETRPDAPTFSSDSPASLEHSYAPNSRGESGNTLLWVVIALLAAALSAMGMYVFMLRKQQAQSVPQKSQSQQKPQDQQKSNMGKTSSPTTKAAVATGANRGLYTALTGFFSLCAVVALGIVIHATPSILFAEAHQNTLLSNSQEACGCSRHFLESKPRFLYTLDSYRFSESDNACLFQQTLPTVEIASSVPAEVARALVHTSYSEAVEQDVLHDMTGRQRTNAFSLAVIFLVVALGFGLTARTMWKRRDTGTERWRLALCGFLLTGCAATAVLTINSLAAIASYHVSTYVSKAYHSHDIDQSERSQGSRPSLECQEVEMSIYSNVLPSLDASERYSFSGTSLCPDYPQHKAFSAQALADRYEQVLSHYRGNCRRQALLFAAISAGLLFLVRLLRRRRKPFFA